MIHRLRHLLRERDPRTGSTELERRWRAAFHGRSTVREDPDLPLAAGAECRVCGQASRFDQSAEAVYAWCITHTGGTGHDEYFGTISGDLIVHRPPKTLPGQRARS